MSGDPARLARWLRVGMAEDDCRAQRGHAPMGTLRLRRGGLALCDANWLITPTLQGMIDHHVPRTAIQARERRDGPHGCTHVTICYHKEWRTALQVAGSKPEELLKAAADSGMSDLTGLVIKGLGTASDASSRCWYFVIEWPAAASWRSQHGLPAQDFHMTVGFTKTDVHNVAKGTATLIEVVEMNSEKLEPEPAPEPAAGGLEMLQANYHRCPSAPLQSLLDELINLGTLYAHLQDYGTPDPSDPVEMRSLLKTYRMATIQQLHRYSRASHAVQRLRVAVAGSSDAKALTHALKRTIGSWAATAKAVPYPDTWSAPGVLASLGLEVHDVDAGGAPLIRTLSAQAKRQAEVARRNQLAAEQEEAVLTAELIEATRQLAQYQQQQKPNKRNGDSGSTTSGGRKMLICIRHGKSLAQGVPNRARKGLEYTDAKLAGAGRQQALDLASSLQAHHARVSDDNAGRADTGVGSESAYAVASLSLMRAAELVVVSPLTRALQTACHIFGDCCAMASPPAFICHTAVAEIGGIPENNPRTLQTLRKDKDLTCLELFPSIDFSLVAAEPTWPLQTTRLHKQSRAAAVRTFLEWLRERPERHIVLVSHHNFLQELLSTTEYIPNCVPIVAAVHATGRVERVASPLAPAAR